jgi:hypothetical protein
VLVARDDQHVVIRVKITGQVEGGLKPGCNTGCRRTRGEAPS